MSEFKVEKGIPMPPRGGNATKFPWLDMAVGDSFVAPRTNRMLAAASEASKRYSMKFTSRKIDDATVRIWRVA